MKVEVERTENDKTQHIYNNNILFTIHENKTTSNWNMCYFIL